MEINFNIMKITGIILLSIASMVVLVGLVFPVVPLIFGLGIDIPSFWARAGKPHLLGPLIMAISCLIGAAIALRLIRRTGNS